MVQVALEQRHGDPVEVGHILETDRMVRAGPLVSVLGHERLDEILRHRRPVEAARNGEEHVLDHVELALGGVDPAGRQPVPFGERKDARLNLLQAFGWALDEFDRAAADGDKIMQIFFVDQVQPIVQRNGQLTLPGRNERRNRSAGLRVRHKRPAV